MHAQSKYSLKQAELLILLLSFPCSIFTYSTESPLLLFFLPFSLFLFLSPSSSLLSCSPSTAAERSNSSFEGPHPPPASSPPLSPLLPRSLSESIYCCVRSVGGYVYVVLTSLTHSSASLQSRDPLSPTHKHTHTHTHIHTHTQALIPGLSGPFNFHHPVVLTSPPFQPPTPSLSFPFHTLPLFSLICLPSPSPSLLRSLSLSLSLFLSGLLLMSWLVSLRRGTFF